MPEYPESPLNPDMPEKPLYPEIPEYPLKPDMPENPLYPEIPFATAKIMSKSFAKFVVPVPEDETRDTGIDQYVPLFVGEPVIIQVCWFALLALS